MSIRPEAGNKPELDALRELISTRLGLRIRESELARFVATVGERYRACGLGNGGEYLQFLQRSGHDSQREWDELSCLLTTGETFFFRDHGQIELLRARILPELLTEAGDRRTLRLWSAGCSSGEEAYTLAMLLCELLPNRQDWNLNIVATDIAISAMEKAKRGKYTSWSFRNVESHWKESYFHERAKEWEVHERLRDMVSFQLFNLLTDPLQRLGGQPFDLIVCRNVFIYFEDRHITSVAERLVTTLREGGYLLSGHGELRNQRPANLQTCIHPQSVIYRKTSAAKANSIPTACVIPPASGKRPEPRRRDAESAVAFPPVTKSTELQVAPQASSPIPPVSDIETLLQAGQHRAAREAAEIAVRDFPRDVHVLCLLARALANMGQYKDAAEICRRASEIDAFRTEPHYVLAHIAEEHDQHELAKSSLKKVLYLEPEHIAAHLELAEVYLREHDSQRARKHRQAAWERLQSLPPDTIIDFRGPVAAGDLARHLEQWVNHG